jgi:fatty acid desaturase
MAAASETVVERHTAEGDLSWRAQLSREEIASLLRFEDWRSGASIAFDWAVVGAAMAGVAWWPHAPTLPLAIVVALFLIGARQLGFAVLMHEASHRSLFESRRVNDWAGQWLCAYPIWSDTTVYRPYHLQHHAHTGTRRDPDLGLIAPFPITRKSLWRKVWRDLSGQTGAKFARAAMARSVKRWSDREGRRATIGVLVTNALLLGALAALGHPALYLLWVGAWLTTNTLVTRIRSIAEHALTPNADDPLGNTRTTLLRWWERLLIGPNRVNYHLEHHLLMTVPHYQLPRMHALLREKGLLARACVERGGYAAILRNAASKPAAGDVG